MGIRIKAAILLCLLSAAAYSVFGAYESMQRSSSKAMSAELSAGFADPIKAEYFLRDSGGYVAVYEGRLSRTPVSVTAIETQLLRDTDRELLAMGIPVPDGAELLQLLEDLGS